jgi:hypothetical protein
MWIAKLPWKKAAKAKDMGFTALESFYSMSILIKAMVKIQIYRRIRIELNSCTIKFYI